MEETIKLDFEHRAARRGQRRRGGRMANVNIWGSIKAA
jgi:hypothetical protein